MVVIPPSQLQAPTHICSLGVKYRRLTGIESSLLLLIIPSTAVFNRVRENSKLFGHVLSYIKNVNKK